MAQYSMIVIVAFLALSSAAPAPDAKADPQLLAAAAPLVAAPAVAAPVAYTAPVGYVGPAVLNAGYTAYSPYTGSLVVV